MSTPSSFDAQILRAVVVSESAMTPGQLHLSSPDTPTRALCGHEAAPCSVPLHLWHCDANAVYCTKCVTAAQTPPERCPGCHGSLVLPRAIAAQMRALCEACGGTGDEETPPVEHTFRGILLPGYTVKPSSFPGILTIEGPTGAVSIAFTLRNVELGETPVRRAGTYSGPGWPLHLILSAIAVPGEE